MSESERMEPSSRYDEIENELAIKRARIAEINLRAPESEFRTADENMELSQLAQDIARLQREQSPARWKNAA